MTTEEYAAKHGITPRAVRWACRRGKLRYQMVCTTGRRGNPWSYDLPEQPYPHMPRKPTPPRPIMRYAETPQERLVVRMLNTLAASGLRRKGEPLNWEMFRLAYQQAADGPKRQSTDILCVRTHEIPRQEAWL